MQRSRRARFTVAVVFVSLLMPAAIHASSTMPQPPGTRWSAAAEERPATDLRVALSRLLGEHAFLIMETMRSSSLGMGEQAALGVALDDNSFQLRDAIESVYGETAGRQFADLWNGHVELLLAYADAGRRSDVAASNEALRRLDRYVTEFSAFLADANEAFEGHDEAAALQLHIDQLTAFSDGDYARAYAAQREAFGHMFALGDHLALGIVRQFPERYPDGAVAFSPRADLQLLLDRLLAEHLVLAAETMRAGVAGTPDFRPGSEALAGNSADLAGAVGSVYGQAAGDAFGEVWRAHVDAYLTFVAALGSGDGTARSSSLMQLHAYHDEIATFLAAANPNLQKDGVAALIRRHVQALISQAEATAAGDHERAVATTREAYAGMFEVGAALADAIVRQFPDRFKDLTELPGTSVADDAPSGLRRAPGIELSLILGLTGTVICLVIAGFLLRDGFRRHR